MRGDVVSLGLNVSGSVQGRGWVSGLARLARVAVAACAALVAGPAMAQPTAEEIAEGAVNRIRHASVTTVDKIVEGTTRAVAGVELLDRNGAPNARIVAFGQNAVDALQRMGQAGRDRIATIRSRAVAALENLQAPQALIDQVNQAAMTGRQAINQAQQRGVAAVRDAVEEAIGPP